MDFRVYDEIFAQMMSDVQIMTSQMASVAADVRALRLGLNFLQYPYHTVPELYEDRLTALMTETWSPFLPLMSGTRTLILAGNAIVGVLWALLPSRDDGDSSRPSPLPELTTLVVENTVLNPGDLISFGLPSYIGGHSSNAMDTLDLFLSHRLELGMGLRELVICDDVRYRKEHTENLKRYVETIIYPALDIHDETR